MENGLAAVVLTVVVLLVAKVDADKVVDFGMERMVALRVASRRDCSDEISRIGLKWQAVFEFACVLLLAVLLL